MTGTTNKLVNVLTDDEVEWLNYAIAHMLDDNEPEDGKCAEVLQHLLDRTHYPSAHMPVAWRIKIHAPASRYGYAWLFTCSPSSVTALHEPLYLAPAV